MLNKIGGYISATKNTAQEHLEKWSSYLKTKFIKSLSEFNLPLEITKWLNKLISGVIDSKKIFFNLNIIDLSAILLYFKIFKRSSQAPIFPHLFKCDIL